MAEVIRRQPLFGKDILPKKKRGRKPLDLKHKTFGRLTVLDRMAVPQNGYVYWLCRCSCGKKLSIAGTSLTRKTGGTRSCGCLMKDYLAGMRLGVKSSSRKRLSDEQIAELRWTYESGAVSQRDLAKQFGVTQQTIFNLVNNITRVPGKERQPKRRKLNIAES